MIKKLREPSSSIIPPPWSDDIQLRNTRAWSIFNSRNFVVPATRKTSQCWRYFRNSEIESTFDTPPLLFYFSVEWSFDEEARSSCGSSDRQHQTKGLLKATKTTTTKKIEKHRRRTNEKCSQESVFLVSRVASTQMNGTTHAQRHGVSK